MLPFKTMTPIESTLLAYLFLKGVPSKKETLKKVLGVTTEELIPIIAKLNETLRLLPFSLLENETDLELTLNSAMTELLDPYIKKEKEGELTQATLQTLTIIAYLNNPSKYEISYIRGVASNQSIAALLARGLIEETTADTFTLSLSALSHLGVTKKEELPSFQEIRKGFLEKIHNAIS